MRHRTLPWRRVGSVGTVSFPAMLAATRFDLEVGTLESLEQNENRFKFFGVAFWWLSHEQFCTLVFLPKINWQDFCLVVLSLFVALDYYYYYYYFYYYYYYYLEDFCEVYGWLWMCIRQNGRFGVNSFGWWWLVWQVTSSGTMFPDPCGRERTIPAWFRWEKLFALSWKDQKLMKASWSNREENLKIIEDLWIWVITVCFLLSSLYTLQNAAPMSMCLYFSLMGVCFGAIEC